MATIEIPDYLVEAAGVTPDDLKVELAIRLYEQRRLSINQAHTLAGTGSIAEFYRLLVEQTLTELSDKPSAERVVALREVAGRLQKSYQLVCNFVFEHMGSTYLLTPLNSILALSKVMLKELDAPITEQQRQNLAGIHRSAEYLLETIYLFLDVSLYIFGSVDLYDVKEVNLKELIQRIVIAKSKYTNFEVEQSIPDSLPSIRADGVKVSRAMTSIFEVVKDIHPDGRGKVTFTVNCDSDWITITVATNEGRPLQSVDNPRLFVIQSVAELHGGKMRVENRKSEGWVITLTLPIR